MDTKLARCSINIHRRKGEPLCLNCAEIQKKYFKEWRAANKDKTSGYTKTRWRGSKAEKRNRHLKYRYGITSEEWELLFEKQDRSCACCGVKDTEEKKQRWHTEHNHNTNKIRGITCERCNRVIGQLGDNATSIMASVTVIMQYLTTANDGLNTDELMPFIEALRQNKIHVPENAKPRLTADAHTKPRHSKDPSIGKNGLLGKNKYYTPEPQA